MPVSAPEPAHPLAGAARPGLHDQAGSSPLRVALPAREIVQVLLRRGHTAAAATAMAQSFGITLPEPGRAASSVVATALWIQPGGWMLTAPRRGEGVLAAELARALEGHAAVVDQSHGRTTLVIEGPLARTVLAKGCRLDLHPREFGPGRVASTTIAQVTCLIHQVDALPRFELTVFSTLARPFFHWLADGAAEYGCAVG